MNLSHFPATLTLTAGLALTIAAVTLAGSTPRRPGSDTPTATPREC